MKVTDKDGVWIRKSEQAINHGLNDVKPLLNKERVNDLQWQIKTEKISDEMGRLIIYQFMLYSCDQASITVAQNGLEFKVR